MMAKRVLIIANKWWECNPLMNVLLSADARPKEIWGWPIQLNHPHRRPSNRDFDNSELWPIPRATFLSDDRIIEVWCISDLLEQYPDKPHFQSSSRLKNEHLPLLFSGRTIHLVVGFGTVASTWAGSDNGNVIVGTKAFMHSAVSESKNAPIVSIANQMDVVLDSTLSSGEFDLITSVSMDEITPKFISSPSNPAESPRVFAEYNSVAVATLNVSDYSKYSRVDAATIAAYEAAATEEGKVVVDTTIALIRAQSEAPFLFIGGIANRVGQFDEEVLSHPYSQNFVASHNAAIVAAWMVPRY